MNRARSAVQLATIALGPDAAGKLRRRSSELPSAFEKHFAFSAFAARDQRNHNRCKGEKILFPAKRIKFNVDVMKHTSVGQLLLVGVQGLELGVDEAKLLRRVQPGGFILFGRNIKTPEQLRKLVDDSAQLKPRRADHYYRSGRWPSVAARA